MLLTRVLPPQFLLPSRGARQLALKLQRSCMSDSTPGNPLKIRKVKPKRSKPSKVPQLSLFDELFPEEKDTKKDSKESKVDKLPPFQFDGSFERKWRRMGEGPPFLSDKWTTGRRDDAEKLSQPTAQNEQEDEKKRREATVLVLNCASKRLEESDFFRIGHKGTHIQGWTTGIMKVIQARDESTLEPLGHYFILFSRDSAARLYLDQTIRLHRLSKSYAGSLAASTLPPLPGLVKEGEDPNKAVKSFTLVPGQGTLSLRLVNRPYRPGMTRMLSEGGSHAISSRQSKGEGLVLFSLDLGTVRAHELRNMIGLDGKRRNLHWVLADDGITKIEGRTQDAEDNEAPDETLNWKSIPRSPSKYMIAFKDRNEARRFVREWHRRPLPLQRKHGPGDEAPPMVNAQILW